MNKDERQHQPYNVDISVHCRQLQPPPPLSSNTLHQQQPHLQQQQKQKQIQHQPQSSVSSSTNELIDIDSSQSTTWNESNQSNCLPNETLSNLLEIRLTFQHYRCQTLANYLCENNLVQSNVEGLRTHSKSISSSTGEIDVDRSNNNSGRIPKQLTQSQSQSSRTKSSEKDFHILFSKITRFEQLDNRLESTIDYSLESLSKDQDLVDFNEENQQNQQLTNYLKSHSSYDDPSSSQLTQNTPTPTPIVQHSNSLSFSDVSSMSLPKDVQRSLISPNNTNFPTNNSYDHHKNNNNTNSQPKAFDFRSVSEYAFVSESNYLLSPTTATTVTTNRITDACSLPLCMDEPLSSKTNRTTSGGIMLDNHGTKIFTERTGTTNRVPSYVSISRAISGYANYNRYSTERESLPLSPNINHNRRQIIAQHDQVDNFCSLPYEPTSERANVSDQSGKGFLQKKIESLYGESFAEDWKKSRAKCVSPNKMETNKRSPSCPPTNRNQLDGKSFQKINSLDCGSTNHSTMNNLVKLQRSATVNESDQTRLSTKQDGKWFLTKLELCSKELQSNVDRYENILEREAATIPDETVGLIRSTIGKANLLMNKKLNQFSQLCHDSLNQREDQEFKIKSDDLIGFWDMVMIQIEEVQNGFAHLEKLNINKWQTITEEDDQVIPSVRKKSIDLLHQKQNLNSPSKKSASSSPSRRASGDNSNKSMQIANDLERELERKNKLIEIKRQGKLKAKEAKTEEEITIFMSIGENVDGEAKDVKIEN